MHGLRDEETQRNGMVGVAYNVGSAYTAGKFNKISSCWPSFHRSSSSLMSCADREAVWRMAKLVGDLPTKFRGIHYCYDNENVKMLFSIAMYVWEKHARIRCRTHFGTLNND